MGLKMKRIGLAICLCGSVLAILFIPCKIFGTTFGWHFIFGDAGFGMKNYQFLEGTVLLLELILINGVGLALLLSGKKKEDA
jgi:hypothetical protein